MCRPAILLLLLSTTTACTIHSGVPTTPTILQPAKLISPEPKPTKYYKPGFDALHQQPATEPGVAVKKPTTSSPTPATMNGGIWVIENFDESITYQVPMQFGRATTLRLPEGLQFNSAVGGLVNDFLLNVSYAGAAPAISAIPKFPGARTNLQLTTTGDEIYSFDLCSGCKGIRPSIVTIRAARQETATHGEANETVAPQGAYTQLNLSAPDGKPMPAWAPAEAWADAYKLVVRFPPGPLPVMPALFAGQEGEQIVSYRTVVANGSTTLVTSRRITEGELRLDQEVVTITAAAPAQDTNPHGWRQATSLRDEPPGAQPVNVYILPGDLGNSAVPVESEAQQPMADHLIRPGI